MFWQLTGYFILQKRVFQLYPKHARLDLDQQSILPTPNAILFQLQESYPREKLANFRSAVVNSYLYHEIDTGDKGPVVSKPYQYDRVKQGIIDYHIEKMLQEGAIRPIQSPYASPVVLTRKNNGIHLDSPATY
ncbi:hypothetical protein TNCV_698761 [Trichonephila clavipes]|nr:hypothetical protein TNCV_698761 [Trichonephila clavipes]